MIEYKGKSCADAFCGKLPFSRLYVGFFAQISSAAGSFPQPRPNSALLHTFCGQQCAQAPRRFLKSLILIRKAVAALQLSSACAGFRVKVLHGICG
ncbi:hypothetical protein [Massilia sp. S19_KUP03_FR1]|uniref:hypothetical protein n=1 Tax=Massilia sp. S19_KUP03_FR1 TaxID=3025503 RepID=UPI002FCCDDAA